MTTAYTLRSSDFIADLLGKARYTLTKSQRDGNLTFDGHRPTPEEENNAASARRIAKKIERVLAISGEGNVPALLEMYDILHRIGFGTVPDSTLIDRHRNRVVEAWRNGSDKVQESAVYRLLPKEERDMMLRRWLHTLMRHNRFPSTEADPAENYRRLALLMRENLRPYLGEYADELKRIWYAANRLHESDKLYKDSVLVR